LLLPHDVIRSAGRGLADKKRVLTADLRQQTVQISVGIDVGPVRGRVPAFVEFGQLIRNAGEGSAALAFVSQWSRQISGQHYVQPAILVHVDPVRKALAQKARVSEFIRTDLSERRNQHFKMRDIAGDRIAVGIGDDHPVIAGVIGGHITQGQSASDRVGDVGEGHRRGGVVALPFEGHRQLRAGGLDRQHHVDAFTDCLTGGMQSDDGILGQGGLAEAQDQDEGGSDCGELPPSRLELSRKEPFGSGWIIHGYFLLAGAG
jgi:hypothetical protein